jgi:phage protein U
MKISAMFWKLLPDYISIGMSQHEFWHGDTRLHKAYREADKRKIERISSEGWIHGMYVVQAVNPSKRSKKIDYPKKPIRFTPLSKEEKKRERDQNLLRFLDD